MITNEAVQESIQASLAAEGLSEERIAYLERLVSQARAAAAVFTQFTQEDVDRIVKSMVLAGLEQAQHLARLAFEETEARGHGRQGHQEHGGHGIRLQLH